MTRDAARKGELFEKALHSALILGDVRINLAVSSFKVSVGHQTRPAVARAGDVKHVQAVFLDDAIEVDVDEIQPWRRAPMAEQTGFDVLALERLFQQWIVV